MNLLIKITLVFALAVMTFQPMAAKKDEPSYNFSRALEEAQRGNKQSAMEYFNKEVADNPQNGYAYMAMAAFHMDNSDYGEARNAVESALKYLPKKDKGSHARVLLLRGQLLAIECDTVGAYSDMAAAIKLDPTNEEAYEKRAQLLYEQGRYDDADTDYQKILALNPGGVMGRMGLGRNSYARKDYVKAIEQYNRIIALNPDYSSGYSFRAEAYLAKGEHLKAIEDICKALEIDSDSKAHYLLFQFPTDQLTLIVTKLKGLSAKHPHTGEYEYYTAQIYNNKRMFLESNEALERAYSIDARSFLLEMIADNYSEMGDYGNALKTIDRSIQMNPDDDNLIGERADILGESGDVEGAISQWSEFIKKNPDFYGGYYRRGFFEDNSGKTEEALADYDMAVMLSPQYAYAHLGSGDMLEKLGRHDEAIIAYQKVVELDTVPNNESCAMYALLALDRKDDAIAFMEKVIANDSINPGNYYDAACFTCRLGDREKSLKYLRTAFEKGFRRFDHIRRDDDLADIRGLSEFEKLISEYEAQLPVKEERPLIIEENDSSDSAEMVEIPFTPVGGVTEVRCSINDLPLKFIFDTGASIVSLSMVEANFMMKNGYLTRSDVVGSGNFFDANGDISEGTIINLREIDFGGLRLDNVRASVVRNQKAPLLLGQSVLGRLGKIEIDNQNKKLIIKPNK